MMSTIKDVAREAGVSIATVSYYLNKKPVSGEKSKKIAEAIKKLNYVVQGSGRDLRAKGNSDIGILFPNISEPYYEKIISSIKGVLAYQGRNFSFELSDGDPESETKSLLGFIGRKFSGIILYSCQPGNREIFDMLASSGIPFVLIDRKPENFECNFISCDNYSLFRELTDHLIKQGRRDIVLVCGPGDYNENAAASSGYNDAFRSNGLEPGLSKVIHTRPMRESGFQAGIQLLQGPARPPAAVLATSFKLAEGIRYAFMLNRIRVGEDPLLITSGDSEDDIFYHDPSILKTSRSAFKIGETAGRLLLQNIKSPVVFETQQEIIRDTFDVRQLFTESIFASGHPYVKKRKAETINVLVLDDYETMKPLQQLLVDFQSREDISLNISGVHPEHLYNHIVDHLKKPASEVDAFLFDMPWLHYLAENDYLLNLDDYFGRYAINTPQYIPGLLDSASRAGGHYYSLPYIASTQLLFYRRDLFTDEYLLRQYEQQYKIPLSPPKNWLQFSTTAQFFTRNQNPLSPVEYGHAMDLFDSSLLMCNFLPRLWAYGGDLYNRSGQLSLNTAASKRAVRNLLECVVTAHPEIRCHPADAVNKLITGKVAMVATFVNYAADIADRLKSSVAGKIGYARIPGAFPVMGGWSFGICRLSRSPDAAFKFIKWASCADIAVPQTILGGQSPQLKTYRNYDMVSLYPWLPMALSEFANARIRQAPLEKSRSKYPEELVERIIAGELFKLVNTAASGVLPAPGAIELALSGAEDKIGRIKA